MDMGMGIYKRKKLMLLLIHFLQSTYKKQGLSAQLTPGLQSLPSPMRPAGQRPHLGPEALSWQSTPVGSRERIVDR